ncbi:MAG: hypothetical protein ACLTQP_01155 [Faecalibacterium prausnitzii]
MKRLTAQRPILYGGRMYQAGDTLPAYDKRMVQAWLSAESAKMTDDRGGGGHNAPAGR